MQSLIYFFVAFVDKIRSLVGLVLPMFRDAADFRSWPVWLRALATVIVFWVIFYGLYWLNGLAIVQHYLKQYAPDYVRAVYLPLVFALLCVLSWIGYFWWKLFNAEDAAEYPDIAAAWEEAVRRLGQEGIRVGDVPLYLVVGRPETGDDALFVASNQKIKIRVPNTMVAPVRVFAGQDAVFVTCSGASTWGTFVDRLANPDEVAANADARGTGAGAFTITPGQALAGVDEKLQEEFYELLRLQSDRPLTAAEEERLYELGDILQAAKAALARRVTLTPEDRTNGPRRLAYLCRLIARDRRPWCPVNGALVLVPWAALETDELCATAVGVLSGDLSVARTTFRQRYPMYVMVCDLEQASGFDEFRRGFKRDDLKLRIGQRIPLMPDRPPEEMPGVLEAVAEWVRLNVMPSFVLNWLRLEWPPENRHTNQFVPTYNRKLFQFLFDLFVRGPRLGRVLARGLPVETAGGADDDPAAALPLVGGCYFAATGREERNQAFVAGVFQKLTESQDAVAWSRAALADDRVYARWAVLAYLAAFLLAAATAAGVYWQFFRGRGAG
ncbi:type VI secretion protein IcmF/TssM N-terminal domain-containing protein [Fimbriiglobus ruber]|uniref:Type VI secretion system component TssM1 N-terminal domain-containing protein n=1 Tax=Fimbriiglobus ruber TaxID=1908690 RepID=A0A225DAC0_9BACT|nr:type VI secretion protein IcmF/TssM N-terminal domain-containing protein [Fimbriiglobus ruber]OWK37913.1 hypothetical protein FRUB_07033 [Fimbriiglobus ruber]